MFQKKKLKRNATYAIAEVAEIALCASSCALPTSASAWLERRNVDPKKTASIVSAPRSLRSLAKSGHTGYRSNVSGGSSHSLATAEANEQKARLRMRQLEEKRSLLQKAADLRHQREREEADLEHEAEMLEASHELEAATIERQVLQEELENGGFLSDDDEDASRPPKQGTPKIKVLCDTINLTPITNSDPVVSNPKEEQRAVPKLSVPKTSDQGTKTASANANQSSEFQNSS